MIIDSNTNRHRTPYTGKWTNNKRTKEIKINPVTLHNVMDIISLKTSNETTRKTNRRKQIKNANNNMHTGEVILINNKKETLKGKTNISNLFLT